MKENSINSRAADGRSAFSLNLRDYAGQWEHRTEVQPVNFRSGAIEGDPIPLDYYALERVVYCANPTNPELQVLCIYAPAAYMKENADGTAEIDPDGVFTAPTGQRYTAKTAPIVFYNSSGGYGEMALKTIGQDRTPSGRNYDFLEEGFIFVGIGGRGKTTKDANGNFTGKIPASAVDLKAGIRFMRANSEYMPGDTDKIISIGFSSGGAMSVILGAEGNSPYYDPYLKEIGAADTRDDIFCAVCCASITNLEIADAAFEWVLRGCKTYTLFSALGGGTHAIDEKPIMPALSKKLYDWFVKYVQDLGLDLGNDGRSGSFYTGFLDMYEEAIGHYVALNFTTDEEIEKFLNELDPDRKWLIWNEETRTARIKDLDTFAGAYLKRMKWVPSLDTYDYLSNEGPAFGLPDGTSKHFSVVVRDQFAQLIDEFPEAKEYYDQWAADIDEDILHACYLMTPVNFIINDEKCDIAPYWRFRTGSKDADHGLIAGWLTAQMLAKKRPDVEVTSGVVWNVPHAAAEYRSSDLMNYIHEISAK